MQEQSEVWNVKCSWDQWSTNPHGVKRGHMDCWERFPVMLGNFSKESQRGWYDGYDEPSFGTPCFETRSLVYRAEISAEPM